MANTKPKVKVTLSLDHEAHQLALDHAGYRGVGDLVSRLIMEHNRRERAKRERLAQKAPATGPAA